jgi:hypothetical protein
MSDMACLMQDWTTHHSRRDWLADRHPRLAGPGLDVRYRSSADHVLHQETHVPDRDMMNQTGSSGRQSY